jgi:hypothetical protein
MHFIASTKRIKKKQECKKFIQCRNGRLAQLAARMLSMHEVAGSIPPNSTFSFREQFCKTMYHWIVLYKLVAFPNY